jgi:hypothetical protein
MLELAATKFTICYAERVCVGVGGFTHAANAAYLFQTRADQNMKDVTIY